MWSDSGQILLLPLLEIDILTEVWEVGNDSDPTQCTNYNICLFFSMDCSKELSLNC